MCDRHPVFHFILTKTYDFSLQICPSPTNSNKGGLSPSTQCGLVIDLTIAVFLCLTPLPHIKFTNGPHFLNFRIQLNLTPQIQHLNSHDSDLARYKRLQLNSCSNYTNYLFFYKMSKLYFKNMNQIRLFCCSSSSPNLPCYLKEKKNEVSMLTFKAVFDQCNFFSVWSGLTLQQEWVSSRCSLYLSICSSITAFELTWILPRIYFLGPHMTASLRAASLAYNASSHTDCSFDHSS
jgi:hypothetical protein